MKSPPRTKTKSLDNRLSRALELVVRARVPLDLFSFLAMQSNLDAYEDVLIPYWDYFRFDRTAQETAFHVRINNLFTRRPDTDNLPELFKELADKGALSLQGVNSIQAALDGVDIIRKGVKHVRDKAIAHQDDTLTSREVYAEAQLTLPRLVDLSNAAFEIANALCTARGLPTRSFLPDPTERLVALLEALRRKPSCPPDFLQ